ncbi:MAG: site-2 protease family protein [Acidobacteria bacterium]|nr:site-2 protease family protein [Acidobacteriota bacterium]
MSDALRPFQPFAASPAANLYRQAAKPTAREWARHGALLALTALTCTFAGTMLAIPSDAQIEPHVAAPVGALAHVVYVPAYYFLAVAEICRYAAAHTAVLAEGVTFAAALLAILAAHESGHYVACRRYGVRATLPFFIPAPPLFLAGTFGAFIKIKSPIPTRRALFDIGVAGPLAGFLVLIPVAVVAVLTTHPAPPLADAAATAGSTIYFNDPPLLRLLARALRMDIANAAPNPFYFAAWIGLLVTSLNLLPVGQLDGGHAVFAVLGKRAHRVVARAAFAAMVALAFLGWRWHHAPGGFVYAVLLFVMLLVPHPRALREEDSLGRARLVVAWLTLAVFLLSFEPFPVSIS